MASADGGAKSGVVTALDGLKPGRFGAAGAEPGLTIEERRLLGIAEVALVPAKDARRKALEKLVSTQLPDAGAVSHGKGADAVWIGPGRYLLISAAGERERWLESVEEALAGSDAAVTDLSHARTVLRLRGPAVREVLAKGCPIDVDGLTETSAATTLCAGLTLSVIGVEDDCFDVAVMRSFGQALWEWLSRAAEEFGYEVIAPADC